MKQSFRNTVWETPFQSFTQVGFPSSRRDIREIKTLDIKALQRKYTNSDIFKPRFSFCFQINHLSITF